MPATEDFEEDILALPNTVGVEYDEENGVVVAFVKEKVPEEELAPNEIVANSVEPETDVIETGEFFALRSEGHTDSQHRGRYRPIEAGCSEGQIVRNMAGTGGPLARVQHPDSSNWAVDVERGDLVRISNCHVYAEARARPGLFGDRLSQPGRLDGGPDSEAVGKLVGYVPVVDEVMVDCAARTTHDEDVPTIRGFDDDHPRATRREYGDLRGQTLTKSGRTTAVSSAEVIAATASVRVNMGDRTVLFRNQILTGDMSRPGDSGSPVLDSDGQLTGLLFAGSDTTTVLNQIVWVEDVLGVQMLTADDPAFAPEEPEPEPEPPEEPAPPAEPEPPAEPQRTQTLQVGPASLFETVEYSFDVEGIAKFGGRSTSQVGDRINGWVNRWSNTYQIKGYVRDQAFPEGTNLRLNGEHVRPDEVVARSKELAGVSGDSDRGGVDAP